MDKYVDVKGLGVRVHEEAGFPCLCFEDNKGRDWYLVRKDWKGAVLAVWPDDDNTVGSFCENPMDYIPVPGQTLYEVDPAIVPHKDDVMKLLGYYTFDGKEFTESGLGAPVERTKEDILADLIKLQEELKAL